MPSSHLGEPINADHSSIKVGLVGPCAAGKSTLAGKLKPLGLNIRQIAQEHSYVPNMWAKISKPDLLIFLDVSFAVSQERKTLNWNHTEFEEQQRRLQHAREHANLYIHTDDLTPDEVKNAVVDFLKRYFAKNPLD